MIDVTLNTISIIVTQYNNTRLISTTTAYGNLSALNVENLSELKSIPSEYLPTLNTFKSYPEYVATKFFLANGTDGQVGTTSFAWPQPYFAVSVFWYHTPVSNSLCANGAFPDSSNNSCTCVFETFAQTTQCKKCYGPGTFTPQATFTPYFLSSTFYQAFTAAEIQPNIKIEGDGILFPLDNSSFSSWLMFQSASYRQFPDLRSCFFFPFAFGPPAVKIPVAVLTATTTTTIQKSGNYGSSSSLKPAMVPSKTEAPQTMFSSSSTVVSSVKGNSDPPSSISKSQNENSQSGNPQKGDDQDAGNQRGKNSNDDISQGGNNQDSGIRDDNNQNDNNQNYGTIQGSNDENDNSQSDTNQGGIYQGDNDQDSIYQVDIGQDDSTQGGVNQDGNKQGGNNQNDVINQGVNRQENSAQNEKTQSETNNAAENSINRNQNENSQGEAYQDKAGQSGKNQGKPDQLSENLRPTPDDQPAVSSEAAGSSPAIRWAGSTVQPDVSSQYNLPGIGYISPGGTAVTMNNVVYSLAPSATAIMRNGKAFPLNPVAVPALQPKQTFVLVVADSTYAADSASNFIVASQTLIPGGISIVVSGTTVSIAPGGLAAIIGSSTQVLVTPVPGQAALAFTFAGSTYTEDYSSKIIVAGQTLNPGGPAITLYGTSISLVLGGGAVIIGFSTQLLQKNFETTQAPAGFAPARFTYADSTYTADPFGDFDVADQKLTVGGSITISNTYVLLSPDGIVAVIDGRTQTIQPAQMTNAPALILEGSIYPQNAAGQFRLDDQTLALNKDITISDNYVSLSPEDIYAIDEDKSKLLVPFPVTNVPAFTIGRSIYTADASFNFIIDGQTLSRGGTIFLHGTRISLPSDKAHILIDTTSQPLFTATIPVSVSPPPITFAGSTYTATSASIFIIANQTLSKGGIITVAGTLLSYPGTTDPQTKAAGLGDLIMSGFVEPESRPTASSVDAAGVVFTGGVKRLHRDLGFVAVAILLITSI